MAWRFTDPPDVAVITTRSIARAGEWIAFVSHDADDGTWQFHDSSPGRPDVSEGMVLCLEHIVEMDPSVAKLADLPLGWYACRESQRGTWLRAENKPFDNAEEPLETKP